MWVCSKYGFFSIVQKDGEEGVQVRARVRADLCALLAFGLKQKDYVIHESLDSDYRYRILISHQEWAEALSTMALHIDYPNFKGMIKKVQGHIRAQFYGQVWSVLYKMGKKCDA